MRIFAVAITYHPDASMLTKVLHAIASQVQGIVVIDNGSRNAEEVCSIASALGVQVVANKQNLGIAKAQNQGIKLAQAEDFSHILLLDQDTVLAPGVVADLARNLANLEKEHGAVAAIGPAYYEVNSRQRTRAYRGSGPLLSRISVDKKMDPLASDFIIASGSLIPLSVLEKVGEFKEELFIDLVDVEWCFRARAAGYRTFLCPTANVDHHLGSGTVYVGRRQIAVHAPVRNYYWVRNALWLARQYYTPLAWRIYLFSRCLAFLAVYTTMVDNRTFRFKLIVRGARDGLAGHLGQLEL
ncbi:glycosyltransferase family 2 protein [Microvirga terrestris]|uniref:Glycosyltransferase family 2 protein n=1 Tax=Microvirga terrestris TaxID=2791024 RepID=A0ABS0HPF6_9HYPH|nr:glycosyltransferase family 2 protein [Microvirga terrestris]MBF9195351.1 glycosyltransferase family 2 protein [Microvirga terrestris]